MQIPLITPALKGLNDEQTIARVYITEYAVPKRFLWAGTFYVLLL